MYIAKINFHSERKKFLIGDKVEGLSQEAIKYLLKENIIDEIKEEKKEAKPKRKKAVEKELGL